MSNRQRRNKLRSRRRTRNRYFESLEPRLMLAVDWRNPVNPFDVNGDMSVSPIDALIGINELNNVGPHSLAGRDAGSDLPYLDVSGDNEISPIDVLQVINLLNDGRGGEAFVIPQREFVSEFEYQITLGQQQGARHYRLALDTLFDTSEATTSIDDVFNIFLIDPEDRSTTLLDRGRPGTALFSKIGLRTEFAAGLVRFDGNIVEIDLSSLADRDTGLLRLQHINGDSSTGGRVSVRPLSNTVDSDAVPGTLVDFASELGTLGGALNLVNHSPLIDAKVEFSQIRFNSATGLLETNLQIQSGGQSTGRNVAVTFPNLPTSIELLNRSGETTDGVPYINLQPNIADGGLTRGARSRSVLVQFNNASLKHVDLTPVVLTGGENKAPVFDAVGDLRVMPGEKLSVALSATDPDGDRVTYSLRNNARLPNGTLNANGTLSFSPGPNDMGTYQFDLVASDGAASSEQTVTLQVAADPVTSTRVSGIILDVHQMPLAGMQVEIGAVQGLTMPDGTFTLDLGSGPPVSDTIKIRGELFPGSQAYPFIAEKLPLVLEHSVFSGVNNVIERPIYLPALDMANGMTINPAQDTTVTTTAIPGASVRVSAGTLMNQQGTPFAGALSITEVPRNLTPAALPRGLSPDLVVTIQPGEMVFASPAPLSLPNRAGYAPGRELDLWSINPVSGEFDIVGRGRVSADGSQIETITGGIRNSSWHMFTLDDDLDAKNESKESASCGCDTRETNSRTELYTGTLLEDHTLPSYQVMGQSRSVRLVYDSLRADPKPLLQFGFEVRGDSTPLDSLPSDAEPMLVSSIKIGSNGVFTQVPGSSEGTLGMSAGQYFWSLSSLMPTDIGSTVQFGMQADLREASTGVYDFQLDYGPLIKTNGALSGTTSSQEGKFASVNTIDGPLGSGWGVAGARRLMEDGDGSVIIIDGDGSEYLYRINEDGTYTNPAGDFSTLIKADDGSFEHRLRNGGREINRYLYSADQRKVEAFNAYGLVQTIRYQADDVSRIDRIIDELSQETRFDYSADGKVSRISDPTGRTTDLNYYETGELKDIIEPGINGQRAKRTFMYDDAGRMTGEITPRGFIQKTTYDEFGRVVESKRADGTIVKVDSVQSQILRSISIAEIQDGQKEPPTRSPPIFSGAGRTTFDIDPATGSVAAIAAPGSLTTSYTYTQTGLLESLKSRSGQVSEYGYDNQGRLSSLKTAVSTPSEAEQRFEYDAAGNRTAFIDERAKRTEYAYDSQNRLTVIRDADGNETTFGYDLAGNLTETTDGRGNRIINEYDARNRLVRTIDEEQGTTRFGYDNEGNLTRVTDPSGNVTTNVYDVRNRLIRSIAADGGKTEFQYDLNDNLISLTDPDDNTTRFHYDARDRLIREVDPLGKSTLYEYDAVDNLVRKTDRNSRETRLVYDPLDRLTTETWTDADGATTTNSIHYAYDDNSNLTQVYDAFSALSYTYDERDRVITVDNSMVVGSGSQLNTPMPNVLLTYSYDAAGNVSSVTDTLDGNAGATTVYGHDDLDRITSITQTGSNTSDKHVEFGYNELGQFTSIERFAAQSDLATQLVAQSSYVYDDLNRLSLLEHTNRSGNRLNFFDFTFDASSRITSIEDIDGLTSFSYDRTDQLVAANRSDADPRGDESYSYDKNGNRISSHRHGGGYETGAGNRLLSDGTYNYEYDNEGNQVLRTEISSGATRAFEYDHRNRLVRVTDADGSGTPTQIVEYVYDALDRRIAKSVDNLTGGASPAKVTQFVYDREDIILQYEGDAGATTALAHRNLHGPGIDQSLAQDDGQETVWMLADHLGTVTDIVASNGIIVSHRSFDTFGNIITPFDGISYGYTGREFAVELSLHNYRLRFYDPSTATFIGEDPMPRQESDVNPFRYVLNSPASFVDPYGLDAYVINGASSHPKAVVETSSGTYVIDFFPKYEYLGVLDGQGQVDIVQIPNGSQLPERTDSEFVFQLTPSEGDAILQRAGKIQQLAEDGLYRYSFLDNFLFEFLEEVTDDIVRERRRNCLGFIIDLL